MVNKPLIRPAISGGGGTWPGGGRLTSHELTNQTTIHVRGTKESIGTLLGSKRHDASRFLFFVRDFPTKISTKLKLFKKTYETYSYSLIYMANKNRRVNIYIYI